MRFIIWGINYAPEVTGIGPCNTALCRFLHAAGHDVEMVTTFPYYPSWRKRPEDQGRLWRTDEIDGVKVHRCWHYVPARVNRWKRMVHEATFVKTSLLRVLTLKRADCIVAVSPPLLLGPALWLASRILGARSVFHVQDLQPDAALGLGMLKPGLFTRLLYAIEKFSYEKAWRVSGISHGMLEAFAAKGVPKEKLVFFPNGVTLEELPVRGLFRRRHGISETDFLAVYSGNIGIKQGLDGLVKAAAILKNPRVRVVICGDGAQREAIAAQARDLKNITMLPLLPQEEYHEMLADTDLAVITQQAASGRAFFPSKLLPALAAARPILAVADEDSELSRAVRESGCGECVLPSRPEDLAQTLKRLAESGESLASYAKAGRHWVEQFEQETVLRKFAAEMLAMQQG